jgi:hypothetical protein
MAEIDYFNPTIEVERNTVLVGTFKGKYIGDKVDFIDSTNSFEKLFKLEVLSGVFIIDDFSNSHIKWSDNADKIYTGDYFGSGIIFPRNLTIYISDNKNYFNADIFNPAFKNVVLTNQTYVEDQVLGDISLDLVVTIKHIDILPYIGPPKKTPIRTGQQRRDGNYICYEYYYSDRTTYWGEDCDYKPEFTKLFSDVFITILGILLVVFLLYLIINFFEQLFYLVLFIIGISLITLFISYFEKIISFLFGIALIGIIGFVIYNLFNTGLNVEKEREVVIENESYISKKLYWKYYDGRPDSVSYKIKSSDVRNSQNFRNYFSFDNYQMDQYKFLVTSLLKNDNVPLWNVYNAFDSLRTKSKLDRVQFAEAIVSSIQSIEYVLITESACNYKLYDDDFTVNYLREGKPCYGFQRFGILSPVEFITSLKGDCDTRTLFLFSVLKYFNYDVVMLNSLEYKHSILGINLTYKTGTFKVFNNKKYFTWETTNIGYRPGELNKEYSNLNNWEVVLNSK